MALGHLAPGSRGRCVRPNNLAALIEGAPRGAYPPPGGGGFGIPKEEEEEEEEEEKALPSTQVEFHVPMHSNSCMI